MTTTITNNGTLIGSGGAPNDLTGTALTASASTTNPNKSFMSALCGYAYFDGAEGVGAGTMGGGSAQAYAALTGKASQAVLGWEGIGTAVGAGSYTLVAGLQATAFAQDTVTVAELTAFHARPPFANGGTPTVGTARSIHSEEPTVGNDRFTFDGVGRHRFGKGIHPHVVEVTTNGNLLQWSNDGTKWAGYASDGASKRITLDPSDNATRFTSTLTGSGSHLAFFDFAAPVFTVSHNGGLGAFGQTPPAVQPSRPTDLAGVIAVLAGCGLTA